MVRLTSKEEEILGYFWAKGPLFVRELLDLQEESKPHYNTLSTIVRSLEEKGYIGYKVYGNTHQYYALVSEDEYRRNSLKQVISKYYDNSYTRVVSTLIEEEVLTIDEAWTVNPERFHSSARNTPFGGWQVTGRPLATIIGSNLVFSRINKED